MGDLVLLSDEPVDLVVSSQLIVGQLLGKSDFLCMLTEVVSIFSKVSQVLILNISDSVCPRVKGNIRQPAMFVPTNGAAVAIAAVALILETAKSLAAAATANSRKARAAAAPEPPSVPARATDDTYYEQGGEGEKADQQEGSLPLTVLMLLRRRSPIQALAP